VTFVTRISYECYYAGINFGDILMMKGRLHPAEYYVDPELRAKLVHPDDRSILGALWSTSATGDRPAVVRLSCWPNHVELAIEDDGCGFELKNVSPEHLGLGIMRERAESIGAALTIQTQPGQGTRINVVWSNRAAREGL
jgi:hypothetical protein